MPRIAILAIILMPLLYGAMYLWAFWNPFGEVNKIPAALVNSDRGTVVEGQPLNAGDQVTQALLESGQLDLKVVSAEDAHQGLEDGTYYFTITLPENFSEAIASPLSGNAQKAALEFTYNDTNNYLSTIIGQDAAAEVLNQISDTIGAQTLERVIATVVSELPQVTQAVDGANELAAGLVTAQQGSAQLAGGIGELVGVLDVAVAKLDGVAGSIQGLPASDVAALSGRMDAVAQTIEATANFGVQAESRLDQAIAALQNSSDPVARQVGNTLALAADRGEAAAGIDPSVVSEIRAIRDDSAVVASQLGNPNSPLSMALNLLQTGQLQSDLAKLQAAGTELNDGASQLNSGLVQLSDGANQLADGLNKADSAVPNLTPAQQKNIADTVAGPVELKESNLHEAPTFGTGFAPFFLSLALFVGGIITWMLLTPLQRRPVSNGLGALRTALASYWPALLIGICQVAIMYVVVHFGVGLRPVYVWGTIGFLMLVSATWLAIIQMLNAVLGTAVGRVATLATLMLMLVASGGIYPVETTATPFQWLHPYDPMTYTVNGLRQLTVGGIDSRLWIAIGVLVALILVSIAATAFSARRDRQFTMGRLYPPIEV